MDNNYLLTPSGSFISEDELAHWGIKGMRWGVRRYQNKDGSLTAAGKKHRAAEEAKLKERERNIKGREKARIEQAKIDAKKRELDAREKALKNGKILVPNKPQPKPEPKGDPIKKLSDDELRAETNRMRLEKEYYDARKNLAAANPKQVSAGKKFMNSVMNDVVVPAAKSAGKEWLEKTLKDALGVNDKGSKSKLPEVKTWDDMTKKQTWEANNSKKKPSKTDQQIEDIKSEIELLKQKKALADAKKRYKDD
jgi:hypothetical protein